MRFSIFAAAVAFVGAVLAQTAEVSPTAPILGTVWHQATNVTIKWAPGASTTGTLPVTLLAGDNPAVQKIVANLGNVDVAAKQATILVPNVASGWYTLRIGQFSYSHYFIIEQLKETITATMPQVIATTTAAPVVATTAASGPVVNVTPTPTPISKSSGASASYGKVMPLAATAAVMIAAALAF
ncbi:hypothetical protein BGZ99_004104 [Dissophora globulifera]|uniref:Ser-Thr-rich glycosyl-phosphatidyl-inositol-anchored membrane family-domain-containing protein n=1 Tax=Dissophora globulifera TaxID=979702 RepID=A0A9P6UVJ4_9FUNG|nr:hypothetical protein BGZ99_004104 [Dissophora globulifera]